jgi:hypothetical protein
MSNIEHILYKLNKYNSKLEQNNNNKIYKTKQKYYLKEYDQFGGMNCPICLRDSQEIIVDSEQLLLNCGHSICSICINRLLTMNCPICRTSITTIKKISKLEDKIFSVIREIDGKNEDITKSDIDYIDIKLSKLTPKYDTLDNFIIVKSAKYQKSARPFNFTVTDLDGSTLELIDPALLPLQPGDLPPGLIWLSFDNFKNGDHPLRPGVLPNGLKTLYLDNFGNGGQPLQLGVLPNGLQHLNIGNFGNGGQPLQPGVLPNGLLELNLGNFGNGGQPLQPGVLPNSLKGLSLGNFENGGQQLKSNVLPNSLKWLYLDNFGNGGKPLTPGDGVVPIDTKIIQNNS